MRAVRLLFAALALAASTMASMPMPAYAVDITFDAGTDMTSLKPQYTENGITFTQFTFCGGGPSAGTMDFVPTPFISPSPPGDLAMYWNVDGCESNLQFAPQGGGTFDLISLTFQLFSPLMAFQGCLPGETPIEGGGHCSYGFNPDALAHTDVLNWTGLAFVDICTYCLQSFAGGGGYLDDVVVDFPSSVPEPASGVLIAGGLGVLWLTRRRRKAAQ